MSVMEVVMSQSDQPTPEAKWVKGVSAQQTLHEAAHRILHSRLSAVSYWLPLAAERSDEDVEYVHQLRVSTRRAVEALRVFSGLIPRAACEDLRGRLGQVRLAADEARNLDVLCADFVRCADGSCDNPSRKIGEVIEQRRRDAQQPIVAVYGELVAGKFNEQIDGLLKEILCQDKGKSNRKFGR